ncbi:MAG: hypothetical protein ACM3VT_08815 [Solirubrobacterales bacterium]
MMRLKLASSLVWSLILAGVAIGLAACDSKEPPKSGSSNDKTGTVQQTATPPAATAPAPVQAQAPAQAKLNAAGAFTKADAEAVLGKLAAEPTVTGDGQTWSNCAYVSAEFTSVGLMIRHITPAAFDNAQAMSKSQSGVDPVAVTGFGEKAYWAGGKLNQLNVLKSGKWLIITVAPGDDKSLDLAKKAAEKILPRVS